MEVGFTYRVGRDAFHCVPISISLTAIALNKISDRSLPVDGRNAFHRVPGIPSLVVERSGTGWNPSLPRSLAQRVDGLQRAGDRGVDGIVAQLSGERRPEIVPALAEAVQLREAPGQLRRIANGELETGAAFLD